VTGAPRGERLARRLAIVRAMLDCDMPRRVDNPPNPWTSVHVELLGEPPLARLSVHEERASSILSRNESPDLPFRWGCNPYRGCFHACAYCYARTTHQYLGWGAGTDFEREIVVKVNAPELLAQALARRSWKREAIVFSGATDCYQPLEASYALTRACLQVCLEHATPVSIITKSALVRRDADLLAQLAQTVGAVVYVSIPFADDALAAALEPGAASSTLRFDTLARLAQAGVPTGVMIAPILPGLGSQQIPEVLARAAQAGATRAGRLPLRLPAEVATVFEQRLREALPTSADHVLSLQRQWHGGRLNESRFGRRQMGAGAHWRVVDDLFRLHARRHGLAVGRSGEAEAVLPRLPVAAGRPAPDRQGFLFGPPPGK